MVVVNNSFLLVLLQPVTTIPVPPKTAFAGKTAIVTGANTGLGLETARYLLQNGSKHVIMASRNIAKGQSARDNLLATPGVPSDAEIEVWQLDMASFASTRAFAAKVNALENLDYLFLNAGIATKQYNHTADGWETMLQVNALSTALLGLLLLPKLIATSRKTDRSPADPPRLVITSSGLHETVPFKEKSAPNALHALNTKESWDSNADEFAPYSVTKLLNVFTMRELADLVPIGADGGPEVVVTAVCPGLCTSELQREGVSFPIKLINGLFAWKPSYGARSIIAAGRGGAKTHRGYISNGVLKSAGGAAAGPEAGKWQRKVWGEMVTELKAVAPEVEKTLKAEF